MGQYDIPLFPAFVATEGLLISQKSRRIQNDVVSIFNNLIARRDWTHKSRHSYSTVSLSGNWGSLKMIIFKTAILSARLSYLGLQASKFRQIKNVVDQI